MLIQVYRTEFVRQIAPAGTDTWNLGNTKGVNLIPYARTEFDFLIPPYIQHNSKAKDGFGDASALAKYRIISRNEKQGNYMLSTSLSATIPTGSYSNGNKNATVLPAMSGGKGFGNFDVQSSLGATLPVINGSAAGRPIAWNTTAQYHLSKIIWPEIEDNATIYKGGPNDGKSQNFLSPGLMFGKYKLRPLDPESPFGTSRGRGNTDCHIPFSHLQSRPLLHRPVSLLRKCRQPTELSPGRRRSGPEHQPRTVPQEIPRAACQGARPDGSAGRQALPLPRP
jgi:hypothetical protein